MNYLVIGLLLILIIILYYSYRYFTNKTLTSGLQKLETPTTLAYHELKASTAITYNYQCWLYLSAPTSKSTPLFSRGISEANNYSEFSVELDGQKLVLKGGNGGTSELKQIMLVTNNFPIQKWTHLVINVSNLSTYEAYINGKLVKTVNVSNSANFKPTSNTSSLVIGNTGLAGYVTKFTRETNAMDAKNVWNEYLSGNGINNVFSNIIPYGLTMTVANGEDVQRVFNIF
jgi:hypothetical protein